MDKHYIYLDHAATTPVHPEVLEAMLPYFRGHFGNPSSVYRLGQEGRRALDEARGKIAGILNCLPQEILFTSCGSESDNLAIRGAALARRDQGNHIITSSVEHKAVINTCHQLEKAFGFRVTYLPVDRYGMVDPQAVKETITNETVLISIICAQNEVGTVQPIAEISEIARRHGIPFHTDAVQAAGHLDLDVEKLGADMLSLSAHKFFGPKGGGLLYVRQGIEFLPIQTGGSQEGNRRAGTENVPGIVGMAKALELAHLHREENNRKLVALRDWLISGVLERIEGAYLTGHPTQRLSNSASFVISGVTGEGLLLGLDLEGTAASSGSACTSGTLEPSPVLLALGLDSELATGSLRLTLGPENTEEEIERVLSVLPGIVERLRSVSVRVDSDSRAVGTSGG